MTSKEISRSLWATRAGFFVIMYSYGIWTPRIPNIKDHFNLTVPELGKLFMISGATMLFSSKPVAAITKKFGSRNTIAIGIPIMFFSGVAIALQISIPVFVIAMSVAGFGSFLINASINVQANNLKILTRHDYMGNLTGVANTGSLISISVAALLISVFTTTQYVLIFTTMVCLLFLPIRHFLIRNDVHEGEDVGGKLPWRGSAVVPIYIAIFALFSQGLAEWSVGDWGALFGREELRLPAPRYLFLFLFFQIGMISSRFLLNRLSDRFGKATFVRNNGLLCASIWGASILVSRLISESSPTLTFPIIIAGFLVGGFGVGPFWPSYISAALSYGFPAPIVLARVFSIIAFAFVFGPGLIGFLANIFGLTKAFAFPVAMMFVAALSADRVLTNSKNSD